MTSPKFRAVILTGVSSDPQAGEDKASIPDQLETCQRAIRDLGGVQVGYYEMDGYSRSGYDGLNEAMEEIPPLKNAIQAAMRGEYDVLVFDHSDRLGDLAKMLHNRFKKIRKQLYSARESGRLQDPATYEPHNDEQTDNIINQQMSKQSYRINKIVRNFTVGIEKRIKSGRYSRAYGYGYIKNDQGDLDLDPPVAQLIIQLKDQFFTGKSLRELERMAQASGIPSPNGGKWEKSTIRYILTNPFYAGKVFKDRWRVTGRRVGPSGKLYDTAKPNPGVTFYPGKHQALWSWDEYLRILQELEDRYRKNARFNTHTFTGLLVCSIDGKMLRVKKGKYICRPGTDHIGLPVDKANEEIGFAIVEALRDYDQSAALAPVVDTTRAAITSLEKQITRAQSMTLRGTYTEAEGDKVVKDLRGRIKALELGREENERQRAEREHWIAQREEILPLLDKLPQILTEGDPKGANTFLRKLVRRIEVTPEHRYIIRDKGTKV